MSYGNEPQEDTASAAQFTHLYNVIMIGDSGVGKSSLLQMCLGKKFEVEKGVSTIGVDFGVHSVMVDDTQVQLHVWDTAGQERYRAIVQSYYRGCHACIICYDVTDRESFDNAIDFWCKEVYNFASDNVLIYLVGTKSDLDEARSVQRGEGDNIAAELGFDFSETSALSGDNISEPFKKIAASLLKMSLSNMHQESVEPLGSVITDDPRLKDSNDKGCC